MLWRANSAHAMELFDPTCAPMKIFWLRPSHEVHHTRFKNKEAVYTTCCKIALFLREMTNFTLVVRVCGEMVRFYAEDFMDFVHKSNSTQIYQFRVDSMRMVPYNG